MNNNHHPELFPSIFPSPQVKNQGFQITPQGKPLFFLEALTRKPRLIDLGHEAVQAFGFWEERISNQLSVSRYLLSVITSLPCGAIGEDYPFYSPREPGCTRYETISDKFAPGVSSPARAPSHPFFTDKEHALREAMAQSRD